MSAKGWIKTYRKIQECWIWLDNEPFDKRSAWIDLLLTANHSDKKVLFNGELITVKRGQILTSVRKLSAKWKWSANKIYRFLKLLECDGMLQRECNKDRTLLTLVNYGVYQCDEYTNEHTNEYSDEHTNGNTHGYTNDTPTDTVTEYKQEYKNVKNDKNVKNVKNNIKGKFFENPDLEIAFKDYVSMRAKIKKPMTQNAIDRMIKKVNKLSGGNDTIAIEMLNKATDKCWTDIYELKADDLKRIAADNKPKDEPQTEQVEEELVGDDWL